VSLESVVWSLEAAGGTELGINLEPQIHADDADGIMIELGFGGVECHDLVRDRGKKAKKSHRSWVTRAVAVARRRCLRIFRLVAKSHRLRLITLPGRYYIRLDLSILFVTIM